MRIFMNHAIIAQTISTLITLGMAFFLFFQLSKVKQKALLYSYLTCQSLLLIWSLSELTEAWTCDKSGKWLVIQIQFFPVCFIGFCWLMMCLCYTDHPWFSDWRKATWLGVPCVFMYLMVLTNEFHHLFFTVFKYDHEEFGIGFWINASLVYAYVLVGVAILLSYSFRRFKTAKMLFILLVMAAVIPVFANVLFLSKIVRLSYGITPIPYDITPNAFSITVTLFTIAIIRYRFLNILPLALSEIVYNMKQSILVMDSSRRVVNYNSEFAANFLAGRSGKHIKDLQDIIEIFQLLRADWTEMEEIYRILLDNASQEAEGELIVRRRPDDRYYQVDIRPVLSRQESVVGHIICFQDVTRDKMLMKELNQQNSALELMNQELLTLNRQLEESNATVKELAVAAERSRFARDAHDTVGNMMALLIKTLEAGVVSCRQNPSEVEGQLHEALKVARDGLHELRRSMFGLIPEKLENVGLEIVLAGLASEFRALGLTIDLAVDELPPDNNPAYIYTLYKICQEALTNAWRHGAAQNVAIILKAGEDRIRLVIIDDGRGSQEIKKGFGLSGMEQRVQSLNGTVSFFSDGETGFTVRAEIPFRKSD